MKNIVNRIEKIEEEVRKSEKELSKKFLLSEMKKIGIEKLPYSYNAIKQFIDAETMNVHYNKHYKTYVEKLNIALDKKKYGDLDLEQIVKSISRFNKTVRNNAGGAYNHALFWKMLSPTKQNPKGLILKRIEKDFGTVPKFKKQFEEVAKDRFGSGWVWLVVTKSNKLKIVSTPNQDNPLMNDVEDGGYPVLGLDLWEHAYYLKYKNDKNTYIKKFWDAVNWDFVEKLYKMKIETRIDEDVALYQVMSTGNKEIITEADGKSQSCSSEESKMFKQLLFPPTYLLKQSKSYGEFKKEYVLGWMNLLKLHFADKWKEKNSLFTGHEAGIYDEGNIRSLLMNLTSSYSAFCVIHKDLNLFLVRSGQTPIMFGNNPTINISELKRFFSVLTGVRHRFFAESSNTLKQVTGILKKTDCLGKRNEQAAEQIINDKLGEGSCEIKAGAGFTEDMRSGLDAIIKIDGQSKKAQIKPFTSTIEKDESIIVIGTSSTKTYPGVDLMVFVNVKSATVKIFTTPNISIESNNFVIPKENIVFSYTATKKLDLIDCNQFLKDSDSW
jgi:Fe-Mn family superoxide dismutase